MEVLIAWINTAFLLIGFRSLKYSFGKIMRKLYRLNFVKWSKFSVRGFVFISSSVLFLSNANLVKANATLEVYGGYQTSPHSVVTGEYFDVGASGELIPLNFTAGWKGKSFSMPPYYGLRLTNWNLRSGWGVDFTHSKAYADPTTLAKTGFERLEFTDGINNLTLHRQTKIDMLENKILAYYGYGIGIIVPHVEFQAGKGLPRTFEYQYGGPTLAINGGVKLPIKMNRFVFVEYKFTASWLDVTLNGGGSLETRIFTNALNVGLGFEF